jgi:hypothetical protein
LVSDGASVSLVVPDFGRGVHHSADVLLVAHALAVLELHFFEVQRDISAVEHIPQILAHEVAVLVALVEGSLELSESLYNPLFIEIPGQLI